MVKYSINLIKNFYWSTHQQYSACFAPSNQNCHQRSTIRGQIFLRAIRWFVGYIANPCSFSSKSRNTVATWGHFEPFWEINFLKLKSLIKNFSDWNRKSIRAIAPPRNKLPSAGVQWGVAFSTRYPGLCRVYAQIVLVFEQIPEYFRHLAPFWAFLRN